ncbi:alpha-amylase family glycosyl hydrolase [Chondrinema litorale]|uniref:alpha-amylase family glycosyl hydrolase n=1 Tax=Chondrinema litorale TaxID=2994555 RepID=UPI002543BB18|nr:alpha-amylase family glycosyl hydrolase [Chondrinema litorale]UZR93271.1 alpha-amylase family glycosyl hydrolase [Chondrinema litorale]
MQKEDILPQLVKDDPWLEPYVYDINERIQNFNELKANIEKNYGSLLKFADAHHYLGFNYDKKKKGWYYREWAPMAYSLYLIGDFNGWNRTSHPLSKLDNGVWEIFFDDKTYKDLLVHESLVKVLVATQKGAFDKIPAYMTRVVQNEQTHDFAGQIWNPAKAFKWTDQSFNTSSITEPIIYESHVGMGQEKEGVGTYKEFADKVLPRIKKLGYNAIQLMAVQEHPYYGSFGYHVSNFYAASSRFGTPEDLKYLINKAHKAGLAVIMDIVHSHSVKNLNEGINEFDGTDYQYFHGGGKGHHSAWDSKLFNYGKWEVLQFLLSNVKFWLEEYHFDGFRFDGVTSMMYDHHGHTAFDHYDKYFKGDVDKEAVTYLQLANEVAKEIKPDVINIAEDVSGMPGLCREVQEGGIGFTYRLAMGIPDYWIKLLKHEQDENWNIHEMFGTMTNRRYKEKAIAYAESHDQALVGDKTIAFWLMDKEMYWHMQVSDDNMIIDRGIALHKMIRLFTLSLGGEGYLNFIGNEFGHPEWVDFPREGNGWSYKYAKRQWSLVDNEKLKYKFLNNFDGEMINLIKKNHILGTHEVQQLNMDEMNKTIIFKKGKLIFVFNFHPTNAIFDYKFWVPEKGKYKILLNSDAPEFGGHDRIDNSTIFQTNESDMLSIYNTNRTVQIFKKTK